MSADYTLPPVPAHPDWQVDQCNWLERERDVIASYGKAVAAPILARIAELERSHSEFLDARRAWLASDAIKQSAIDRLCAEVEALRSCLSEHLRAAVACQNSVIETRGTDGMDRLSFANDRARALLAQPAGSWVNPLAAEVEKYKADAERYREVRRGARFSVIDGKGDELRTEVLDAAVDAAIAARKGEGSQP